MSDPDALTIILEPLGSLLAALAGIHWSLWFSRLTSLLALAWRPLFLPLAILGRILFVVFAPVLYVGSFLVGVVGAVLGLIASLEVCSSMYCSWNRELTFLYSRYIPL